jgi:DNA-binding HxlR family transcriptional regulator
VDLEQRRLLAQVARGEIEQDWRGDNYLWINRDGQSIPELVLDDELDTLASDGLITLPKRPTGSRASVCWELTQRGRDWLAAHHTEGAAHD